LFSLIVLKELGEIGGTTSAAPCEPGRGNPKVGAKFRAGAWAVSIGRDGYQL
jgi:hypothetical protein